MKHYFITAYHPGANGLAEGANRKILQVLRSIVNVLLDNWEDWLPQIAASINTSVTDSPGKSPYYILYGMEKRVLYDFLATHSCLSTAMSNTLNNRYTVF